MKTSKVCIKTIIDQLLKCGYNDNTTLGELKDKIEFISMEGF